MGRKTNEEAGADKLNQATAEAARILSGDLAACSKMMRATLDAANEEEAWDEKLAVLQCAMELAGAAVKLGDTIGRLNGETRQHISVERHAQRTEIAPKNAPNSQAISARKPKQSLENSAASPPKEGGGG